MFFALFGAQTQIYRSSIVGHQYQYNFLQLLNNLFRVG